MIEYCIKFSGLLIRNSSDSFTVNAKYQYEKLDVTDLKMKMIIFVHKATGIRKLKVRVLEEELKRERNNYKSTSITNYFKKSE